MKTHKLSISDMPAVVLTFVFISLIGGVGLIILSDLQADDDVIRDACTGVKDATGGSTYYNATSHTCQNGTLIGLATNTNGSYSFIANSQVGISKIGSKLGLIGTIIVLSIVIGLVVSYFAVKNM